ncbi:MAG: ABC transporter, partial [Bradyrhizobium sp.]|nr:ABC transporter [Bradyrhizobium sp.]
MSAVERLEESNDKTRQPAAAAPVQAATVDAVLSEQPAKSARLRPLLALAPYVARYRWRAILAVISLTVAAITTLVVPVAVRRMIDFGFTPNGVAMINSYFSLMVAIVAVLALASACRYYFVMT